MTGLFPFLQALQDKQGGYPLFEIVRRQLYNDLELRANTSKVRGKKNQREIDFVVNDGDKRIYIQSAYQIDTEKKESAELQSMKLTGDFFRKIVIRLDIPHNYYDDNGFFHCNLMDFLLGNIELF